jgi:hypothetical protein
MVKAHGGWIKEEGVPRITFTIVPIILETVDLHVFIADSGVDH